MAENQTKEALMYLSLELEEKIQRVESELKRLRGLLNEALLLLDSRQFRYGEIEDNSREVDLDLLELVQEETLPQKGRLLEAVMKAGPLLLDIMLVGPLPKWNQNPPPLRNLETPFFSTSSPEERCKHRPDDEIFPKGRKRGHEEEESM